MWLSHHAEAHDFRKPTRNHDSHSDLGSAACQRERFFFPCQPSAEGEAGAGPVAERARADEFDAVGGPCGEASEVAIAVLLSHDRRGIVVGRGNGCPSRANAKLGEGSFCSPSVDWHAISGDLILPHSRGLRGSHMQELLGVL